MKLVRIVALVPVLAFLAGCPSSAAPGLTAITPDTGFGPGDGVLAEPGPGVEVPGGEAWEDPGVPEPDPGRPEFVKVDPGMPQEIEEESAPELPPPFDPAPELPPPPDPAPELPPTDDVGPELPPPPDPGPELPPPPDPGPELPPPPDPGPEVEPPLVQGRWRCEDGACTPQYGAPSCGNGNCQAVTGESAASCPADCDVSGTPGEGQPCDGAIDCAFYDWPIAGPGYWECAGPWWGRTCRAIADATYCGTGDWPWCYLDDRYVETSESCPADCLADLECEDEFDCLYLDWPQP
ncbi:MAG: hypothetical protein FJ087_17760 [Deltaproteobacteria bacterium]|nr:hypothetical protein [Deltaproteobacteria bacterium]